MPRKPEWPKAIAVGSVVVRVYEVAHRTNASGKAYVVSYRTPAGTVDPGSLDLIGTLGYWRLVLEPIMRVPGSNTTAEAGIDRFTR